MSCSNCGDSGSCGSCADSCNSCNGPKVIITKQGLKGDQGDPGENGDSIIETTYSELITNITNSTLEQGSFYKFPYTTIHNICGATAVYNNTTNRHDKGNDAVVSFTPATENLIVLAVSVNQIHIEAHSAERPRDIIYYDHTNDLTEDGLISRSGFITYREDPDKGLSTNYDFRNVLHRRYKMDWGLDRLPETTAYLSNSVGNTINFPGTVENALLWAVPFIDAGDANIGGYVSQVSFDADERDYLTFVGLESTDAWYGGNPPVYKNIRIGNSGDSAILVGSGTTTPAFDPQDCLDTSNVVIHGLAVENVEIGNNANGITFSSNTIKNVKIGNNSQNISIGGTYSVITENVQGYADNILLGDGNRNVAIPDWSRDITIGNSNIDILFNGECFNVDIGSYNNLLYLEQNFQVSIGDWNTDVFMSIITDAIIEDKNVGIRWNQVSFNSQFPQTIPNGMGSNTALVESTGHTLNRIGSGCESIHMLGVGGLEMGSDVKNTFMVYLDDVKIGNNSQNIALTNMGNARIGNDCLHIEVTDLGSSLGFNTVGNGCTNIKIQGNYNDIGNNCSNIVLNGAVDNTLEGSNSDIYLSSSTVNKIGNASKNIYFQFAQYNVIGDRVNDLFIKRANNCAVGEGSVGVTITNFGLNNKFDIGNLFTDRNIFISIDTNDISTRPYQADTEDALRQEFENVVGVTPGTWSSNYDTINCVVGKNSSEVSILASSNCVIADNSTDVFIGTEVASTLTYTHLFNCGLGYDSCSFDVAFINANTVFTGEGCDNTVIGQNCDDIKVIGNDNTFTVVGNNSKLIEINGDTNINNVFGDNIDNIEIIGSSNHLNNFGNKCTTISIQGDLSNGNTIGNGCAGFSLVGDDNGLNTIGDNCSSFTITGNLNQRNVLGNNCTNILLIGNGINFNTFGDNVKNVTTDALFAFTYNKVLVDGNAVVLTAAYDKKIYDKASPDGERWEEGIDNAGAFTAPTKLV